jgi:hypothetical protein
VRAALVQRNVHHDVFWCRAELLPKQLISRGFEATKSIAQKIRDKAGLTGVAPTL